LDWFLKQSDASVGRVDFSQRILVVEAPGVRVYSHMTENFRTLRVLVVEDEFLIRWSIAETLTLAGHTVIEAENGAAAILALKNGLEAVDAVVLDYRLPDSNDLTLLATIRRLSPESVVVLMTAFGTPEVAKGALDLGVLQVLQKPFEMDDLQSLLHEACSSRGPEGTTTADS
jgi:DNA-binding NtrC family response regulator